MADFEYRPGLKFRSRYAAYQYIVRPRKGVYAADGTEIDVIPELLAEFGIAGEEFSYVDPDTNEQTVGADIRGHFFDLDQQADEKGWSDEDRALVAKVLLRNQPKFAGDYQLYSVAPLAAPWPTYDTAHHNTIASTAAATGLVAQALAYEKQNKNRQSVVDKLQEELDRDAVADDLVAA